ncbi:putative caspase-like protein [Bradyrhizobium sp. USDA 3240]
MANNLTFQRTKDLVAQFERDALDSDISVIYYAGHGVEAYGENWMIPIDAQALRDGDLSDEAINLKTLSTDVAKSKLLGLIILDACRDNPLMPGKTQSAAINSSDSGSDASQPSRSVKRGLALTEPSGNVLIAFAAKDGTTANDGDGRNSPFTTALLKHIETPGLEVNFLFRRVRDDVMFATRGAQQPYVYGSLSRTEVFLKPTSATGEALPKR